MSRSPLPAPLSGTAGERAAALQAALRLSPQACETQITPTELSLTLVYTTGCRCPGAVD